MKHLLSFLKTENLKTNIKNISQRFPFPILIIIILSWLFLYLIHWDFTNFTEETIIRTISSFIITFFISLGINIASEWAILSKKASTFTLLLAPIFWILFFLGFDQNIDNFENFVFFILTLVWIISFIFFAPYLKKIFTTKEKQSVFYSYFYNVANVFLMSFILWFVLFILWIIAISVVFALFDISWIDQWKLIWDWAVISLALLTPIFTLTQIPKSSSYNKNYFKENKFFSFLTKYIATPFIYIYFLILYAYSVKVLANFWDWPKWEVSWMVIGFSIFGYIIYIFSYAFDLKNKFIKTFRKVFPYVVIPQIFMLFYAIYLRINQYDLTINRYFVVVFWIWLFIISLYYILSNRKSLSTILSTLTIFTIIISIWPWSVYSLPETRQYSILITNLEKANILQNWEIIPLKNYSDIDKDLSKNIYSEIDYLCDFSDCSNIKNLFNKQYLNLVEKDKKEFEKRKNENIQKKELKYREPSKWEIVSYITEQIKVENHYWRNNINNSTINIYLKNTEKMYPLDINWYNKIYKINDYVNEWVSDYVKVDIKNKKITITKNSTNIETIDISSILDSIYQTYKNSQTTKFSKKDLTFEIWNYKIIFENISIKNPIINWNNKYNNYYTNGYLLEN